MYIITKYTAWSVSITSGTEFPRRVAFGSSNFSVSFVYSARQQLQLHSISTLIMFKVTLFANLPTIC